MVYRAEARRRAFISCADSLPVTKHIGQAAQSVNFVWMSVRYGRVYATALVGARSVYIAEVLRARTDWYISLLASHCIASASCRIASIFLQVLEMKPGQSAVFS